MTPIHQFEVKTVSLGKGDYWTVMHTEHGIQRGGDHHWLNRDAAEAAKELYLERPDMHGHSTESEVRRAHLAIIKKGNVK